MQKSSKEHHLATRNIVQHAFWIFEYECFETKSPCLLATCVRRGNHTYTNAIIPFSPTIPHAWDVEINLNGIRCFRIWARQHLLHRKANVPTTWAWYARRWVMCAQTMVAWLDDCRWTVERCTKHRWEGPASTVDPWRRASKALEPLALLSGEPSGSEGGIHKRRSTRPKMQVGHAFDQSRLFWSFQKGTWTSFQLWITAAVATPPATTSTTNKKMMLGKTNLLHPPSALPRRAQQKSRQTALWR